MSNLTAQQQYEDNKYKKIQTCFGNKEKLYIVYDERSKMMPTNGCTCLLATQDIHEAFKFAKENNGVVFSYLTKGNTYINESENQISQVP